MIPQYSVSNVKACEFDEYSEMMDEDRVNV